MLYLKHFLANQVSRSNFPIDDNSKCEEITTIFNNSLRFDPSEPLMAFTIRDPVNNGKSIHIIKYTYILIHIILFVSAFVCVCACLCVCVCLLVIVLFN